MVKLQQVWDILWTYTTARICPFHFGQATHFSVEYVHLLHQTAEGCFSGFPNFLINTLRLHHGERNQVHFRLVSSLLHIKHKCHEHKTISLQTSL